MCEPDLVTCVTEFWKTYHHQQLGSSLTHKPTKFFCNHSGNLIYVGYLLSKIWSHNIIRMYVHI